MDDLFYVERTDLRGLEAFIDKHQPKQAYCPKARKIALPSGAPIIDLPWEDFIQRLWNKRII